MSLEENVSNSVFRGTCINGAIEISGYPYSNTETITENSLRGSVVIAKGVMIGYIANNTKWANGGFTAYLAYSNRTESGLLDIQFVFPAGRLSLNFVAINALVKIRTDVVSEVAIEALAQNSVYIDDALSCAIIIRSKRITAYNEDTLLTGPSVTKKRTGIWVEQ